MGPAVFGPVVQVAYFVPDVRDAARRMVDLHGAGPFHVIEKIELAWGEVRGEPHDFLHTSAYGQSGDIMVELVQQDREGPSPLREMYAPGRFGLHHMAVMVDDLDTPTDAWAMPASSRPLAPRPRPVSSSRSSTRWPSSAA